MEKNDRKDLLAGGACLGTGCLVAIFCLAIFILSIIGIIKLSIYVWNLL